MCTAAASPQVHLKVDPSCPLSGMGAVEGDYDAMLNQTDIGSNANKFYLAQAGKPHTLLG